MIYVTGDCHQEYSKLSKRNFPMQKNMTKDDYVIICGDFGLFEKSKAQEYWLNWLEERSFTILFVDGNHENFDLLNEYKITKWNGGKVQIIRPNIIHLMRGQVYVIDNLKFFTFGGAKSHDISGGILDPADPDYRRRKKQLNKSRLSYRIKGFSWWSQEMPNAEEYKEGINNLDKNDWNVDYVITHCCSSNIQNIFGTGLLSTDPLTDYLEAVLKRLNFKYHYFGHYHDNRIIHDKYIMLYDNIQSLSTGL